ncbi:MAG: SPOR domain-containing protein [Candidatus Andeanibacterium colombiense]|uniref:SPOR domain-containing protein n=1 Tax=Candidatus Andeanibacterium colombiense TaxID=3121345 RepID=A0AAJ5X5Q3_9SPHN|nr:MAG: SPOR domain-containing protein [Sphingomonadaceae bacterium]
MAMRHAIGLAGLAAIACAAPALADVKDGVDAWSRGDYPTAVKEWQAPADKGDPDAMFNLGQAYRLGLGVTADATKAEYYYARAAEAGHVRAADTYGLILFQTGRTKQALPYVEAAAKRGDPRSEYLLGLSYFNGELVSKDWVKAYALLTMANSQGLPQAASAIAQMDQYIPLEQRQQAAGLAVRMQQDADANRANEQASFDLAAVGDEATTRPLPGKVAAVPAPLALASPRVPRPVATAAVDPSQAAGADAKLAAAQDAVHQAMRATGIEDPGQAGADFTRSGAAGKAAPPPQLAVAGQPKPLAPKPVPPKAAATPAAASGPWKLQLGAFGVSGNAEKLWAQLGTRPELRGRTRVLEPAGKLTKLLAGGFASKADADAACAGLKAAGQVCVVTR